VLSTGDGFFGRVCVVLNITDYDKPTMPPQGGMGRREDPPGRWPAFEISREQDQT